jgi:superfamily II DNA/RNA helicase
MPADPPTRDEICEGFIDAVNFELYPFQEEAILAWFEAEGGVLIEAPTGMGKTLIAETAVYEALVTGKQLYYTTPLIALTDQKLVELQDRAEAWGFPRESVGLLTGNRSENPDAPVKVVVAEILLNHLLSPEASFGQVSAVVMDEFHYFNDRERGVVWELSLVLLPAHVRLMLLSATVGNALDFVIWLREQHGRRLTLVRTNERKVPLEYDWVGDKLLTEQLVEMAAAGEGDGSGNGNGDGARTPALVFCFSRDECWELAERLKGLPLIPKSTRVLIEEQMKDAGEGLEKGIASKLRMMLIRGVGVHHAGVLPRYRNLVERLFLARLIPVVVCTETLAAGINLPARSVVLRTLLKGKPKEKKLLPASGAHQMFGRAGRPQFDDRGFVFAMAHEDDVKIQRWKEKFDQLPTGSKDPGILKARKALERKRPSRRKTEQYWSETQFQSIIDAGPAKLRSVSMIPYRFLVYLLSNDPDLGAVRRFLAKRFNSTERLKGFEKQLDAMVDNLAAMGYLHREGEEGRTAAHLVEGEGEPGSTGPSEAEGTPDEQEQAPRSDALVLHESLPEIFAFRSVHPLYGNWLARQLAPASLVEKRLALESMLELPWRIARKAEVPMDLEPGPLEQNVLSPLMISMGVIVAKTPAMLEAEAKERAERVHSWQWDDDDPPPPSFAEMLVTAFEAELPYPEGLRAQTKWVSGGIADTGGDFARFVASRDLGKHEGLVLRHLLRLVILAGEFASRTGDPDYEILAAEAREASQRVDPTYSERFLENEALARDLIKA